MTDLASPYVALVNIPVVFQQAGFLTYLILFLVVRSSLMSNLVLIPQPRTFRCVVGMLVVMIVAGFSATMLCKAMAMVPGNDRFQVSSCGMFAHSDHDLQLCCWGFQGAN